MSALKRLMIYSCFLVAFSRFENINFSLEKLKNLLTSVWECGEPIAIVFVVVRWYLTRENLLIKTNGRDQAVMCNLLRCLQ